MVSRNSNEFENGRHTFLLRYPHHHHIPVTIINEKLTLATFPQWLAQFEVLLIGCNLINFVIGTHPCPAWWCQLYLVLATCKTSHSIWTTLTHLYAGKSQTCAMQFKNYLTLSTRGSHSVTKYLYTVKIIANKLAIIVHPILDDDLTLYIPNGLGPKCHEIAVPIHTRETSLKFKEIHNLLVGHNNNLCQLETQLESHLLATANYKHRKDGSSNHDSHRSHASSNHGRSSQRHGSSNSSSNKYMSKC